MAKPNKAEAVAEAGEAAPVAVAPAPAAEPAPEKLSAFKVWSHGAIHIGPTLIARDEFVPAAVVDAAGVEIIELLLTAGIVTKEG